MRKRAFVGIVSVVALAVLGGRLLSGGQVPSSTRVAVVNIGQVFSKYQKAKDYKAEMEVLLKPYKEKSDKWRSDVAAYQKAIQDPKTTPEKRVEYQQAVVQYKRAMEDLDQETQKNVGKRQEDQIVNLFKDVNDAVKSYAVANGIHLVLAYGEQIEGDPFNFPNINRKMQGMDLGSTNPMVFLPGADISSAISDVLNQGYRRVPGTPTSQQK